MAHSSSPSDPEPRIPGSPEGWQNHGWSPPVLHRQPSETQLACSWGRGQGAAPCLELPLLGKGLRTPELRPAPRHMGQRVGCVIPSELFALSMARPSPQTAGGGPGLLGWVKCPKARKMQFCMPVDAWRCPLRRKYPRSHMEVPARQFPENHMVGHFLLSHWGKKNA